MVVSDAVNLLQSTEKNTRCSGELGDTLPLLGEIWSQEALAVTVNANGLGPPAPMSTNRFPAGTKGSIERVGGGQLYP